MPLVRAHVGDLHINVGQAHAEATGMTVLDESAYRPDGSLRATSRANGRPSKPKTTVAKKAAASKKAAVTEPAPTNEGANQ